MKTPILQIVSDITEIVEHLTVVMGGYLHPDQRLLLTDVMGAVDDISENLEIIADEAIRLRTL
jgi:hypothetical protein